MIKGTINSALEGILRLAVRGPHGQRRRISAVIDTGYNGALTLPLNAITELGLSWIQSDEVELGDGSLTECDFYVGVVIWNRLAHSILVAEADTTPLVGRFCKDLS